MYKKHLFVVIIAFVFTLAGAGIVFGDNELKLKENNEKSDHPKFSSEEVLVKIKGSDQAVRVKTKHGREDEVDALIAEYKNRDDVEYAEPNYIAHALMVPNDPYYAPYQWNFGTPASGGINMEPAWDITKGQGAVVAVIDTGVAYENYSPNFFTSFAKAPDFTTTTFLPGYDFVNHDTHPNDDEGHGTHVASTIAESTNNGVGVAGIAPDAAIMPIKVLNNKGSGTYADIADGIRFAADHGAQVINMSLGGSAGSQTLLDALAYANAKGVTIVAAAGNDNGGPISYPAAYDQYVIAVGATRFDSLKAPYSNVGPELDVVAPGGDTLVDQNNDTYGDGILQQTFGTNIKVFNYYFYQGTSMATPHVAGIAALLIANHTATNPIDIKNALQSTAHDLGALGYDTSYGFGLVDAYQALRWTGATTTNPTTTPPVINSVHVSGIGMTGERRGGNKCRATALIEARDQNSTIQSGTVVQATWSGAQVGTVSGTTNSLGQVSFSTPWKSCGTFTIRVTNLNKPGFSYNSSLNTETSDSVTP